MDPTAINIEDFSSVHPDKYIICPYDSAHDKVIAKRFPYHILKCRKNWNGHTMLSCIFNARHIVPASQHKFHIQNCPDRASIEADIAYEQRKQGMHQSSGYNTKGCTDLPSYERSPSPTEDWDEENSAELRKGHYQAEYYLGPAPTQNLSGYLPGIVRAEDKAKGAQSINAVVEADDGGRNEATKLYHTEDTIAPISYVHPESTASLKDHHITADICAPNQTRTAAVGPPPGFTAFNQLKLPRQPARAGQQSMPSNRGRYIAANIFENVDHEFGNGSQQPTGNPLQVAKPAANNELGAWKHPISYQQQHPAAGIGHGLVPSGGSVGRGLVPGIGRGITIIDKC